MFFLLLGAGLGGLVLLGVGMMIRSMFMATRGRKIPVYDNPGKALIVLDIQEGYAGTNVRQPVTIPASTGLIGTVNRLIDAAERTKIEVVYVRQVFSNHLFVRMHGGKRLGRVVIDRRIRVINGNDFEKNRTDAFSCKELEQFLMNRQVNELYLVGVDAAFCVYYTALGAINRGYNVTVVVDAVRSRYRMSTVLKRYQRKGISVIRTDQLLTQSKPGSPD